MSAGGDGPALPRRSFAVGSPAMDEGRNIVGVEAAKASATPRHSVTQRDRSCAGKTTERGTERCLTGQRKLVITNVARFRAPADSLCQGEGIGRTCMVKPRGETARVNEEVCARRDIGEGTEGFAKFRITL